MSAVLEQLDVTGVDCSSIYFLSKPHSFSAPSKEIRLVDTILTADLQRMNVKFDQCIYQVQEDVTTFSQAAAQDALKNLVPKVIAANDLAKTFDVSALEIYYEDYVDKQVETLRAENVKL